MHGIKIGCCFEDLKYIALFRMKTTLKFMFHKNNENRHKSKMNGAWCISILLVDDNIRIVSFFILRTVHQCFYVDHITNY